MLATFSYEKIEPNSKISTANLSGQGQSLLMLSQVTLSLDTVHKTCVTNDHGMITKITLQW